MRHGLIGTTRCARLLAAVALATMVGVAALAIGQTGVIGAEDSTGATGSTDFRVAGDGSLPTKRPTLGDARDPLSTEETGYAVQIATSASSIPAGATDVHGAAGPQTLYADIPDADVDASVRTALVVLYDYTGNRAYQQFVDLRARRVVRSKSAAGLQPPTTHDEADVAIDIALKAATPRFIAAFEQAEGMPLVSPDQIHYVAGAWRYDRTTRGGKACGAHRCAQLLVSTPAGTYLDTTDFVVDLSARQLVMLERP